MDEITVRVAFNVPTKCRTLLPLELFQTIASVTYTNYILSKIKGIWIDLVLGKRQDDFKNKNFLAACNIYEKHTAATEQLRLFEDMATDISNFDIACVLIHTNHYTKEIRNELLELLSAYYLYCILRLDRPEMERFNVFHNAIQAYIHNCIKINQSYKQNISIDNIISEVAKKVIPLSTDLIAIFLRHLPQEHTDLFCLALSNIQPKDNQKFFAAARLAWLIPARDNEEKQMVAINKLGLLFASLQCPQNQTLPNWISISKPILKYST